MDILNNNNGDDDTTNIGVLLLFRVTSSQKPSRPSRKTTSQQLNTAATSRVAEHEKRSEHRGAMHKSLRKSVAERTAFNDMIRRLLEASRQQLNRFHEPKSTPRSSA